MVDEKPFSAYHAIEARMKQILLEMSSHELNIKQYFPCRVQDICGIIQYTNNKKSFILLPSGVSIRTHGSGTLTH